MSIELVVFDLAGTLVDEGSKAPRIALLRALNKCLPSYHLHEDFVIDKFMGLNKRDHIREIINFIGLQGKEGLEDEIYNEFAEEVNSLVVEHPYGTPVRFVAEVLSLLTQKGIKTSITTGYSEETTSLVMERFSNYNLLLREFTPRHIVTAIPGCGRPKPAMIFKSMELNDVHDVRKVIKVGDTKMDKEAGLNAGVVSLRVGTGLREEGAVFDIEDLTGLFEYL